MVLESLVKVWNSFKGEVPEFKQVRLEDFYGNTYHFNGKLIAHAGDEEGGGQCSFHYVSAHKVYETDQGSFVLRNAYTGHYEGEAKDEQELFDKISSFSEKRDLDKRVKTWLAQQLHSKGMGSFAELAGEAPRAIHI